MRFMVLMYPRGGYEQGAMPTTKELEEMGKFNEELAKSGTILAAEGLHPSKDGARIRFKGGKPQVIDGPFSEAKEIIGGFWLLEAKSRDEVVELMRRCPVRGDEMIEIRQVFGADEFGEALTPELKEREEKLRKEGEARLQQH